MNGILPVLGIVFVCLKLIHVIDWSWWWVTAPFWFIPITLLASILVFIWCTITRRGK